METNRSQRQVRCAFNSFCKKSLRNEAIDAIRENREKAKHEISFSCLSKAEESQLCICDSCFASSQSFLISGREIGAKQLAGALHSLLSEKRQAVLLYYFFDMNDAEIAELCGIPRRTVQYRRTSSFELLRKYLEENADERN